MNNSSNYANKLSSTEKFLTRTEFREQVFARDKYLCVFCKAPAVDAHHILERRLWGENGGYTINNGASVCEQHHLDCEMTKISVEDVRLACGITKPIIPEDMYDDQVYDKWGNIILPNGQRTKGPLFYDESVQRILDQGGALGTFTDYVKYPRTYHLPWSPGLTKDDRALKDVSQFEGNRVIVMEKLDGEQTNLYRDYYHARSVDSKNHPSRNMAKAIHATFAHDIPEGWRICAENMYAKHSIHYKNLDSYLFAFSLWNKNMCLDWDTSKEWFDLFGLPTPKILYDDIFDEAKIRALYNEKTDWETCEGYVVRNAHQYEYSQFRHNVGKYVRKGHIQTTKHWALGQAIVANELKK